MIQRAFVLTRRNALEVVLAARGSPSPAASHRGAGRRVGHGGWSGGRRLRYALRLRPGDSSQARRRGRFEHAVGGRGADELRVGVAVRGAAVVAVIVVIDGRRHGVFVFGRRFIHADAFTAAPMHRLDLITKTLNSELVQLMNCKHEILIAVLPTKYFLGYIRKYCFFVQNYIHIYIYGKSVI